MPASIKFARAMLTTLAAVPFSGWAGTLDYSLYSGVLHSDNITLRTDDPDGQYEFIPGLEFKYVQQGSVLQANVIGNLEYHAYPGNRFDNQTQTQLAGQLNWTVLPERLDFTVEDYAGIQPVDSLSSNSPDNQQQTNVLTLGPTLHLQLGSALRAQAELRYINSRASKTDEFNSSRGMAAFRIFRDISASQNVSLNVDTQRVRFDRSTSGSDYSRNELFGRYVNKLAHLDFDAVLGWSQLNFDHAPSDSSPLARLTIEWRPTTRSTFALFSSYQYADAAQDMILPPGQGIAPVASSLTIGSVVTDSEVYQERRVEPSYAFASERLTFTIAPYWRRLEYLNDATFDRTGRGGTVSIGYRLRPTLSLSLFADGERMAYQSFERRDTTIRYGIAVSRQWTTHWGWNVSFQHQRRNSDAIGQSYRENQIYVGVVFRR